MPASGTSSNGRTPSYDAISGAIARAVTFLRARQLASGEIPVSMWTETRSAPDHSIFPTSLAAWSLSFVPEAETVLERTLDFLEREAGPGGLWRHWSREHRHHRFIPPDLDDTCTASAALLQSRRAVPPNRDRILKNRNRRGLFRTWRLTREQFLRPHALLLFYHSTMASPFDVDAVVNANVLLYLGVSEETRAAAAWLREIIREGREADCDKWYENPIVVRYFLARAMKDSAPDLADLLARRARESEPSNALEDALAACTQLDANRRPGLTHLLSTQLDSGGWPRAGVYHGGRPRRRGGTFGPSPPHTPWWGSEELTTVFCLEALARARSVS